jgi:hypothetical protein
MMKSPKILIVLAVLGTTFCLYAKELKFDECPANVQETIRANARGGKVDEVNAITLDDDVTLYWTEVDVPERREDLKLLVGSDGKLIKTREEIDLADAPAAVREAAGKLVPEEESSMMASIGRFPMVRRHTWCKSIDPTHPTWMS